MNLWELAIAAAVGPRQPGSRKGCHALFLPFHDGWAVKLFDSEPLRAVNYKLQALGASVDAAPVLGPPLEVERDGKPRFGFITERVTMVRYMPPAEELKALRERLREGGVLAFDLTGKNLGRSGDGRLVLVDFSTCRRWERDFHGAHGRDL